MKNIWPPRPESSPVGGAVSGQGRPAQDLESARFVRFVTLWPILVLHTNTHMHVRFHTY